MVQIKLVRYIFTSQYLIAFKFIAIYWKLLENFIIKLQFSWLTVAKKKTINVYRYAYNKVKLL